MEYLLVLLCLVTGFQTAYPQGTVSPGRIMLTIAGKAIPEIQGIDFVLHGHDHTYCRGKNLAFAEANSGNHPCMLFRSPVICTTSLT